MTDYHYVGLDVHKKIIAYCVKKDTGRIVAEGTVPATRRALAAWAEGLPRPWRGAMEATLFTGWIYDFLRPRADELKVGHSFMLKAICAAKKKNDRIDARKLADALRCDLLPECYMAPPEIRDLRRVLRYRNLLVRESVRLQNKGAGLLMEVGAEYDKGRLGGKKYFRELLEGLADVPESVVDLLRLNRASQEVFAANQKRLVRGLKEHPALAERVKRLMSIPAVGEVMALTWALEVGDPHRFRSVKKAVSYCGLCSGENKSAGKVRRGPLSKQRNKHLQSMLVEAANLAPRWNEPLAEVYRKERAKGSDQNEATVAVARKLTAYLLAVDKSGKEFEIRTSPDHIK
jgi:transposase